MAFDKYKAPWRALLAAARSPSPEMTAHGPLRRVTVEFPYLRQILLVLGRHRCSVWRTGHTARSKLPPRYLVLGQPLFLADCFTDLVRRLVWYLRRHHSTSRA